MNAPVGKQLHPAKRLKIRALRPQCLSDSNLAGSRQESLQDLESCGSDGGRDVTFVDFHLVIRKKSCLIIVWPTFELLFTSPFSGV